MTATAAGGPDGWFHEAFVYDSDDALLGVVVPFLQAAIGASELALAELPAREADLLREAMPDADRVGFLPALEHQLPASRIRQLRAMRDREVARGNERARVVTIVPHPGIGAPWNPWSRYEAAINELLADVPAWGLCLYDARVTPAHVLADVERTHPHLATSDGRHLANPRYQPPDRFLRSLPPAAPDPLETAPATAALVDPEPGDARSIVDHAAQHTRLSPADVENLKVAVSEVITNAIRHGRPPTTVNVWSSTNRIVVTVTDRGPGPGDPYAGLVPAQRPDRSAGGLGLWITHQLVETSQGHSDEGFTVRLIAGRADP